MAPESKSPTRLFWGTPLCGGPVSMNTLVIPAGTPHEFGGHDENEGTARWEVRPALRTREFFEGLFGALQAAADAQAGGSEEPPPAFDVADYGDVFRLA